MPIIKTKHGEKSVPEWLLAFARRRVRRKWLPFPGMKFVIGRVRGEALARMIKQFMKKRKAY